LKSERKSKNCFLVDKEITVLWRTQVCNNGPTGVTTSLTTVPQTC
jgi:hypothetical protein